ncbi:MAG: hypothetical protein KAI83_08340 [Thiomargarita sp.]|nr:hypothetical protein [Thiomargarita sp.]
MMCYKRILFGMVAALFLQVGSATEISVCYVLNVPSIAAADDISIGVINESDQAAKLTMTLYDMDGSQLGTGVLDESLGAGNSMSFFDTAYINTMLGISPIWTTGRAMLEIYSTQPNLKTVAFLKAKCPNGDEYLVDISEGASGSSCE